MASWPPSGEPMAHGEPGSPGAGRQRVVPALARGGPDRVDRRQVDDVEAHVARSRPAGGRRCAACRTAAAPARRVDLGALRAREELVPGAVQRPLPVHDQRVAGRAGEQVAQREPGQRGRDLAARAPRPAGPAAASSVVGSSRAVLGAARPAALAARAWPAAASLGAGGPAGAARSNSSAPSASISSTSWPSGTLMPRRAASARSDRPRPRPGTATGPRRSASPRRRTGRCPAQLAHEHERLRRPPGRRSTTPAPSISCPSRNTVAVTSNVSPGTALAGDAARAAHGRAARQDGDPADHG